MTPHTANLINAFVLIAGSAWSYLSPDYGSWTVLIPGAFGLALAVCGPGLKAENKVIAHIAVSLTLIIFVLLIVPFIKAIGEGDVASMLRVAVMLGTCVLAKVAFIKSFKEARRRREQA